MAKTRIRPLVLLSLALATFAWNIDQAKAQQHNPPAPVPAGATGFNSAVNYNFDNFAYSPNIRKFIDSLPGLGLPNCTPGTPGALPIPYGDGTCNQNNLGQYIPIALKNNTLYGTDDYYQIGLKQYSVKMHTDLPPTTLRGYYQIAGTGAGQTNLPAVGNVAQYLGPVIVGKSYDPSKPAGDSLNGVLSGPYFNGNGTPVRILFQNNLGTGNAGKLFLPVDTTLMGAGPGPVATQSYTDNRATLHLHGGNTPWISDGTPHQWITPAGESFPTAGASINLYRKGASFQNVPDMVGAGKSIVTPSAGDGLGTFFWTNEQSQRLMFYHDHAYGTTRLNVYGGMAAGYLLHDQVEDDMIAGTNISGAFGLGLAKPVLPTPFATPANPLGLPYTWGVPLVIQDRTFVNDATTPPGLGFAGTPTSLTQSTDPLWYSNGGPATAGGKLWFPHVYMPNENIYDPSGALAWGRWDYGPWLNPPLIPVNDNLPVISHVPETFADTMIVNGTAFPYLSVPAAPVRFRLLDAGNDRVLNLQLYVAASKNSPTTAGNSAGAVLCDGINVVAPGDCTEVKMVPANANAAYPTWPKDGRNGGVPDPATMGPSWIQIGNEGGILPTVAVIPPQPVNFEYSRRVPVMLNISDQSLLLMPAERADVIVDFTAFAGKTLILYNDAPAPMPLFDERNDLYTGSPDWTAIGGAPTTSPGFGPNTRTVMQIRVGACPAGGCVPFDLATLQAALPKAYKATQAPPIVPQTVYDTAFGTTSKDTYVTNVDETVNLTGQPSSVAKVMVALPGSGFTTPPTVTFTPKDTTTPTIAAVGAACLNGVTAITVNIAGTGYTTPPAITFALPAGLVPAATGTGVAAVATVTGGGVGAIAVTIPGCNYNNNPNVTIAPPTSGCAINTTTCIQATATSAVTLGGVGSVFVTPASATAAGISCPTCTGGAGYTKAPFVRLKGGGGIGATADAMLTGDTVVGMKNITEGFEPWYGRINVQLGNTPVPLDPTAPQPKVPGIAMYIDPPSDQWDDSKIQVFRIAHLGVDSHIVHFHLANLQVINRVDFTNTFFPPFPNELGWKESIRTNPFTDLIVAVKPYSQALPFQIPHSIRLMDPTTVAGSTANWVQPAPIPGLPNPAGISNVMTDYGWEYVWHCHLLGHEENDMMRPIIFNVPAPTPAPSGLNATRPAGTNNANLTWTGGSNSTVRSYRIERTFNTTSFTSPTVLRVGGFPPPAAFADLNLPPTSGTYRYRVRAENGAGVTTFSNTATLNWVGPPAAPTGVTAGIISSTEIDVSWTDASNNEASFNVLRSTDGVSFSQIGTVARTAAQGTSTGTAVIFANTNAVAALTVGVTYTYRIVAVNAAGSSAPATSNAVLFQGPFPPTPPTVVGTYQSSWTTATTPKTVTIPVALSVGDVLVAYSISENSTTIPSATPTGTFAGWTALSSGPANNCYMRIWTLQLTAAQAAGSTVSVGRTGTALFFGLSVSVFRNTAGVGSTGITLGTANTASRALTTSLNSAVIFFTGDFNATAGARTYLAVNGAAPSEIAYATATNTYTVFGAIYSNVGAAGSKTVGTTTPTFMQWTIGAVEVKGQ